jgi:hypothetical protein
VPGSAYYSHLVQALFPASFDQMKKGRGGTARQERARRSRKMRRWGRQSATWWRHRGRRGPRKELGYPHLGHIR